MGIGVIYTVQRVDLSCSVTQMAIFPTLCVEISTARAFSDVAGLGDGIAGRVGSHAVSQFAPAGAAAAALSQLPAGSALRASGAGVSAGAAPGFAARACSSRAWAALRSAAGKAATS